ncbi:MAG: hypothetical protein ACE147_15580, partial [Candidatus Methylomirabilales bacterium]
RAGIERLQQAVRDRAQVVANCGKDMLVFSPHALAARPGGLEVLAFVHLGDIALADAGPDSPARWRWIPVRALSDIVSTTPDTGMPRGGPQLPEGEPAAKAA